MFWFVRYRFSYPEHAASACECLTETLQKEKWKNLTCKITQQRVTLQHKQPAVLRNYWSPIFDGNFIAEGNRRYLVGCFRPDWLLLALNAFTLVLAAYQFISMLEPSTHAAAGEFWTPKELSWQAAVCGALVLLMLFGWLMGVPCQHRILTAIRESTAIPVAVKSKAVVPSPVAFTDSAE